MSNFNIINQIQGLIVNKKIEWKSLWEITIWNKRFKNVDKNKQQKIIKYFSISSKDLNEIKQDLNGDIKLLSTKKNDQRFTSEKFFKNFNQDEVISIPEGGDVNIKYTNGKFINSLNLLCKSYDSKKINLKFIYYYLTCNKFLIINQYKGSAIKHPQMDKILEIKIPIPPLDIQNKIVEILDNFSNYEAELEAELEARTKQYNYYLNKLLDFSNNDDVQQKEIKDVFNIKNGYTPSTKNKEYWTDGNIPWFRLNDIREKGNILYKSKKYITTNAVKNKPFEENSIILTTTATIGVHALIKSKFLCNQQFTCFTLNNLYKNKLNIKFIYYYFYIIDKWCLNNCVSSSFPSVRMNELKKLKIPIPTLNIQNKIVEILDNFSSLVNDIKDGLPKEIELRKKQYQYYLNKLLSFGDNNE